MSRPSRTLPAHYTAVAAVNIVKNLRLVFWLNVAGLGLFILSGLLFARLLSAMRPADTLEVLSIKIDSQAALLWTFLLIVGSTAVTIILHEAVHGVIFWVITGEKPAFAFHGWYAYAAAPGCYLPRNAYLINSLAPLVLLTALYLGLMAIIPAPALAPLLWMATLNSSGCIGDIGVAVWLLRHPSETLAQDCGTAITLYLPSVKRV